jgi:hypothetical protein
MARFEKRDFTRLTLRNRKRNRLSMELLEPRLNLALDVPAFSSLPGANHTIYLDFDGHVTSGTSWNNGATINSPAYSSDADTANFSASELTVIDRRNVLCCFIKGCYLDSLLPRFSYSLAA